MSHDVAVVMIARDAGKTIRRSLDSVRPWVDHLLVLDTGSIDDTVAEAKAAGAEVHHLPWPDDFSIARNHALDLANARWHVVLDADEWLTAGGELLRQLDARPDTPRQIRIDSMFTDGAGQQTGTSWITRILPGHVRYEGRIHEQPVVTQPPERLAVTLQHDGYLPEAMADKHARNLHLLNLSLAATPDEPYLHYQLGKSLEAAGVDAQALTHYEAAWRGKPQAAWRHDLLIRLLHALGEAGRLQEGLELASREQPHWLDSPDFYFVVGELCLAQAIAQPATAMSQWVPAAKAAWTRCLAIGDRPDLSGSVQGRGSHLAVHNLTLLDSLGSG